MQGDMNTGGYTEKGVETSLATPRASIDVSVYGLSVDVFVLERIRTIQSCYSLSTSIYKKDLSL